MVYINVTINMDDQEKTMFLRRYETRIQRLNDFRSLDRWFELYTTKGEDEFLDELEDKEIYNDFCRKYYDILREAYNICSAGMRDYYELYKEKFGYDEAAFRHELRQDKLVARIMDS